MQGPGVLYVRGREAVLLPRAVTTVDADEGIMMGSGETWDAKMGLLGCPWRREE